MDKHNAQFSTSSLSIRCSRLSSQQTHSVFEAQSSVLNKLTQCPMLKAQFSTSSLSIRCLKLSSQQAHSVFDAQGLVLNKLTQYSMLKAQFSISSLGIYSMLKAQFSSLVSVHSVPNMVAGIASFNMNHSLCFIQYTFHIHITLFMRLHRFNLLDT